jgi:dienelactone hydrolase
MNGARPIGRRGALTALAASGTLAAQPPAAPADEQRSTAPASADSGSLYPALEAMAQRGTYIHSFLDSRFQDVNAWRKEARAAVFEALGPRPPAVDPRPEVVDRRDMGEFVREKVVFSTTPEFRVPAYVHIPKKRQGRAPAIVDLHSHGGMFLFGKEKVIDLSPNHPAMTEYHQVNYGGRPTATELARRGYVVITIDALPFGERRILLDEDLAAGWERSRYSVEDVRRLNQKCRAKESTLVKSLTYAGLTWPGVTAWDDIRTVDYLCTRPEVDPARIGCVGVSFGGWRSLFLSGLDDRIRAGCVVGFMSTVKPMIRRHMDTHSFVHFVPGLHRLMDLPDVVALRAPQPLLALQCRRDGLFPLSGMEESVKKIAAIYAKARAGDRFTARFYDLPHIFNPAMQDDAFAWFDNILGP